MNINKLYKTLLEGNKKWVAKMLNENPNFFKELGKGQNPDILWIGCSDSRVPANQITGTKAGEVFVHRNIANLVVQNDMNILSVLDYAVNILEVKHIIVCGHYGCGGIIAAMEDKQFGFVDYWLSNIKDVQRMYKKELHAIEDKHERENKLVEFNIIEQVYNLYNTSIIKDAWRKHGENQPQIHGWVYDVSEGLLVDLKVNFYETHKGEKA